ncbi:MAG: alpha/beta hydrolase-fold protein [Bacteroidia bacterium]
MSQKFKLLFLLAFLSSLAHAQVTFVVRNLPANTPPNDPIFIAGTFNGWNPGNQQYTLSDLWNGDKYISLPAGTGQIAFKFTRGSWASVEGNANGGQRPNRTYTFGPAFDTVFIHILSWEDLHGGGGGSTATAQVQLLTDSFFIPQLNRHRRITLYLPPNYQQDTSLRFPVIYMHDGQNLFDAQRSFAGEWEVDETLDFLHNLGDPGIIVVGIDNAGAQRINEYSPWVNPSYGGGQGDDYVDFIVHSLKPYIDQHFRTDSSRDATAIMGSSMGGFISQYAAMKYQQVFSKAGVFSPSLWFSSEIFNQVGQTGRLHPMRFYLLAGELESSTMVLQTAQLRNQMLSFGFSPSEVKLVVKADGQHSEWFWRREFGPAYQWLFGRTVATNDLALQQLKMYPNPSNGLLYLDLPQDLPADYRIADMQGRVLLQGNYQPGDSLELHALSPGIYLLYASQGQTTYLAKFILQ